MQAFFRSFVYAFNGLRLALAQRNMRVHLACAVLALVSGLLLHISLTEWCLVAGSIGFVISAEVVNTAIEHFVDMVSPQRQEQAGKVKDLAAGAVLVAAVTALAIGGMIFGKHLLDLLS